MEGYLGVAREEGLSEQQAKERMESERSMFENDDIYYEFDSIRLSPEAQEIQRLSSVGHWVVPVDVSEADALHLLAFSAFLHDAPGGAFDAFAGRYRAHRRASADLEAFENLLGK